MQAAAEVMPAPEGMDYSPLVAEHFANPRNAGVLAPGPSVIAGSAGSAAQGVQFAFSVRVEGEHIREVRQQVYGCPHSIAAASWLSERLVGATLEDLQQWRWREIVAALEVPASKRGRMLVLEDALRALERAWRAHP